MSALRLAYLALAVRDVGAAAGVLVDSLGLTRVDLTFDGRSVPVLPIGEGAVALFDVRDPFLDGDVHPGVHHLALEPTSAGDDLVAIRDDLGLSCLDPSSGLGGAAQLIVARAETTGVRTRLTEPLGLAGGGTRWAQRLDHIGVASADNRAGCEFFSGRLGFAVESTQTDFEVNLALESFTSDKYGVIYHNRRPEPVGGLRVSFISVGDCELELLQPFDPAGRADNVDRPDHDAPGNTRGDKGAIGRFLERRGAGLHHLAFKTEDIDAALERVHAAGHRVIDHHGRPGSRRARIGFIHPGSLGGVLLHFVERDEL